MGSDHEEEDACGGPVDLLEWATMVSRSSYAQAVPVVESSSLSVFRNKAL